MVGDRLLVRISAVPAIPQSAASIFSHLTWMFGYRQRRCVAMPLTIVSAARLFNSRWRTNMTVSPPRGHAKRIVWRGRDHGFSSSHPGLCARRVARLMRCKAQSRKRQLQQRSLEALDRPQPAIRLPRKDWLLRADGAVLCPAWGAGCASGSCPAGFFAEVGLRWWRRWSPHHRRRFR
jgi:hypothetical protein